MNLNLSKLFAAVIFLAFIFNPSAGSFGFPERGSVDFLPGPTLLYPVTDNINLAGKELLEFKWEVESPALIDRYEFRLYRGYQTVVSTLISQQNYPPETLSIKIAAKQFEINQVYTWSLRLVYVGGRKGDYSFSPFKIIEK